jgi:Uma2 family endonuclease
MATIPFPVPSRHLISVDAFHRMGEAGILGPEDRVELIEGEIIDMSPIGALHAAIVDVVARHFGRRAGESVFIRCQNPLRLDDVSEPEPDISILRPRADFYTTSHPGAADVLLVIEVADTSLAYDLGTKVPLYARHGIPEVWVIDAGTRRIRVFRRRVPAWWTTPARVWPLNWLGSFHRWHEAGFVDQSAFGRIGARATPARGAWPPPP